MAITLGTPTSSGNKTNSTGFSFDHTLNANAKALVVVVTGYDTSAGDSVINSVTWNTVGLLEIPAGRYRSGSGFISIWYKSTPATGGAYSIAVTPAGTCTDIQATAIGLIDAGASRIIYDSANSSTVSTGTAHNISINPARVGSVAIGGCVALVTLVSSLSVTKGTEIAGSEADMGSQCVGCATVSESGSVATIEWKKSTINVDSYAQIATFYVPKRRVCIIHT